MTGRLILAAACLAAAVACSTGPHYATCAEAPGPLHRGDPGYRIELDRNRDGVACEEQEPIEGGGS